MFVKVDLVPPICVGVIATLRRICRISILLCYYESMRYSGDQVIHAGVRARDLPALMELYELNYIQLRRLVPELDAIADHSISKVEGGLDLYLSVRERSRYTTTINLSYAFSEDGDARLVPDVVVRVYHDAQVAEVLSHSSRCDSRDAEYDRSRTRYSLQTKWQVNRFLNKWLAYCLRQGHSFCAAREKLRDAFQAFDSETALSVES